MNLYFVIPRVEHGVTVFLQYRSTNIKTASTKILTPKSQVTQIGHAWRHPSDGYHAMSPREAGKGDKAP